MGTVSKKIADKLVAGDGWYPGDNRISKIVEYDNAWGGVSYGITYPHEDQDRYAETGFVRNPRIYWEAK